MSLKNQFYFYAIFMMVVSAPVYAVETLIELGLEGRIYAKPGPPQTPDSKLAISLQPEFTEQIEAQNLYLRF